MGGLIVLAIVAYLVYLFFAYWYLTVPMVSALLWWRFSVVQARDRSYNLVTDCLNCHGTGTYYSSYSEDDYSKVEERICISCDGKGCEECKNRGKVLKPGTTWESAYVTCYRCKPTGLCYLRIESIRCSECGGAGKITELVRQKQEFGYKEVRVENPCTHCGASGQLRQLKIRFPNGDMTEKVEVHTDQHNPRTRPRDPREYTGFLQIVREMPPAL